MIIKQKIMPMFLCAVGSTFLTASTSNADIYRFRGLTNNSITDTNIGEAQLFVDVTSFGKHQVLFRFFNIGPAASSITGAYFDDGSLLGIARVIDRDEGLLGDRGVDFSGRDGFQELPGGDLANPPFEVSAGYRVDPDRPGDERFENGVNPNEFLGIVFNLQKKQTFDDVIAELNSTELRIGIHVQGFADGGSESFLNVVPAPASALLGVIGLATMGLFRRRSRLSAMAEL